MKKILIFGGTGFVGTQVCEKLNQASCRVTVATRRREHARHLQLLPLVDVVEIDLNDSAALAALVAGHDAVVNLIAILHGSEEAFQKVHVQWPLTLMRACKAAGVRRVVHISALGAATDSASRYQRSKARGEAALLGAGLDVTALRPSVIFGAGDSFLNTFANLQQVFPVIPLAGSDARFQPVWVGDVASAALSCRSISITSTSGSSCRWRACSLRRVATVTRYDAWLSFSQTCVPTKPLPPKIRIFFMGSNLACLGGF